MSGFPQDHQQQGLIPDGTELLGGHNAVDLAGLYDPAFNDWEMQDQALSGGPFWIGADGAEGMLQDQWMQDEFEMRRLIDAGEAVYADPGMEGL